MPLILDHYADAFTHGLIASWTVFGVVGMLAACDASKPPAWLRGGF